MTTLLVKTEAPDNNNESKAVRFFLDETATGFYEWHDWSAEKGLERLVFRVSRSPNYLKGHLERIYFCFQNKLNAQLFGALTDLSIVLGENGRALCTRMINGSRSRLNKEQYQALLTQLQNKNANPDQLPLSRYSVFSKGLQSSAVLLQADKESNEPEYDPLGMARVYIEVSQLDDAIEILEKAILEDPSRTELHDELLPLYRSTGNTTRFNRLYEELTRKHIALPPAWSQLQEFFNKP